MKGFGYKSKSFILQAELKNHKNLLIALKN